MQGKGEGAGSEFWSWWGKGWLVGKKKKREDHDYYDYLREVMNSYSLNRTLCLTNGISLYSSGLQ